MLTKELPHRLVALAACTLLAAGAWYLPASVGADSVPAQGRPREAGRNSK